jgi:hypothetical protein
MVAAGGCWSRIPRVRVRFHLLSTFPFQGLDQVVLASHCGWSADMQRPIAISCPWLLGHILRNALSTYTVWLARAVDGAYVGDVHVSHGRTSLCTIVRVPCWRTGLAGRYFAAPSRLPVGNPCWAAALRPTGLYSSHRLAVLWQLSARRAAAAIGLQRCGGHRISAAAVICLSSCCSH